MHNPPHPIHGLATFSQLLHNTPSSQLAGPGPLKAV
jgi:hypothetical protein